MASREPLKPKPRKKGLAVFVLLSTVIILACGGGTSIIYGMRLNSEGASGRAGIPIMMGGYMAVALGVATFIWIVVRAAK